MPTSRGYGYWLVHLGVSRKSLARQDDSWGRFCLGPHLHKHSTLLSSWHSCPCGSMEGGRERGVFLDLIREYPLCTTHIHSQLFPAAFQIKVWRNPKSEQDRIRYFSPETETPHSVPDPVCLLLSDPCFLGRCRQWRRSSPLRTGLLVLTAFNSATTDTSYNPLPLRYRLHISNLPWENVKSCHVFFPFFLARDTFIISKKNWKPLSTVL